MSAHRSLPDFPTDFFFINTSICNLRCSMCYVHGPESFQPITTTEIETKYFKSVLNQSNGTLVKINLTNFGEPFCDPALDERLSAIRQYSNKQTEVCLITNGTLLTEANLKRFSGIQNPIKFIISLDAPDPLLYSTIRRNADFNALIHNISNLKRNASRFGLNVTTTLHAVLMRQNILCFPDLVRLAAELGCDCCGGQHVAGSPQKPQSLFSAPAIANTIISEAKKIASKLCLSYYAPPPFAVNPDQIREYNACRITDCLRLENTILLDPKGNIIPCCHQHPVIGNILDGAPISSIWGNEAHEALRSIVSTAPLCEGPFFDETGEGKCGACSALENRKPYLHDSRPFGFEILPEERDYSLNRL